MALKIYGGDDTPLVQCINPRIDKWMILWGKTYENNTFSFVAEIFNHKPSLQEIKDKILDWYNQSINNKILSGFTWREIPVWLSVENQFNYNTAYTIAMQSTNASLPTFKLGTDDSPIYYEFENLEDLKDFYFKMAEFISQILSEGWKLKDSIDWEVYSKLLENYEEI